MTLPPPLHISDARIRRLFLEAWARLPSETRAVLLGVVTDVIANSTFDGRTLTDLQTLGISRSCAYWSLCAPDVHQGAIFLSEKECNAVSDSAVVGAIAHEFGHAFQSPSAQSERRADLLATQWGFEHEIEAVKVEIRGHRPR